MNSGESRKTCDVVIINDPKYEPEEVFYLHLGSVRSAVGGRIGRNRTKVTIRNLEDGETLTPCKLLLE